MAKKLPVRTEIKISKIFDNATSCSSENNLVLVKNVYDEFINLMKLEGGALLNNSEKKYPENFYDFRKDICKVCRQQVLIKAIAPTLPTKAS